MFHPNHIIRYEPVVSDVSDDELINTAEVLEKSGNIVVPSPSNVTRYTRSGRCLIGKSKASEIFKFNPIRSKEAMSELGKKRWVSFCLIYEIRILCPNDRLTDIHRKIYVTQMV